MGRANAWRMLVTRAEQTIGRNWAYRQELVDLIRITPEANLNVLAWGRVLRYLQNEIEQDRDYEMRSCGDLHKLPLS